MALQIVLAWEAAPFGTTPLREMVAMWANDATSADLDSAQKHVHTNNARLIAAGEDYSYMIFTYSDEPNPLARARQEYAVKREQDRARFYVDHKNDPHCMGGVYFYNLDGTDKVDPRGGWHEFTATRVHVPTDKDCPTRFACQNAAQAEKLVAYWNRCASTIWQYSL
jgi:hypothetical protein